MKYALSVMVLCLGLMDTVTPSAQAQTAITVSGPAGTYTSTVTLSAPGPLNIIGVFEGPSGTYTVNAPVKATITTTTSSVTISWGDEPNPPPPPPPPPVNVTGHLYAIGVFDDVSGTADQKAVRANPSTVTNALAKNNLDSDFVVCNNKSQVFAPWIKNITTFPSLLVLTVDPVTRVGTTVAGYPVAFPPNADAVVSNIGKLRGK